MIFILCFFVVVFFELFAGSSICEPLMDLNNYLKIAVFNISENFEFARQQIC